MLRTWTHTSPASWEPAGLAVSPGSRPDPEPGQAAPRLPRPVSGGGGSAKCPGTWGRAAHTRGQPRTLWQGSPTPGLRTGVGPWAARNRAARQAGSGRRAIEASSAAAAAPPPLCRPRRLSSASIPGHEIPIGTPAPGAALRHAKLRRPADIEIAGTILMSWRRRASRFKVEGGALRPRAPLAAPPFRPLRCL